MRIYYISLVLISILIHKKSSSQIWIPDTSKVLVYKFEHDYPMFNIDTRNLADNAYIVFSFCDSNEIEAIFEIKNHQFVGYYITLSANKIVEIRYWNNGKCTFFHPDFVPKKRRHRIFDKSSYSN